MGDQDSKSSVNGSATLSVNTPETSLQHRYTSLLETRIAQLEAIIESSAKHFPDLTAGKDRLSTSNDTKDDKDESSKTNRNNSVGVNKQNESNPSSELSRGQKKDGDEKPKSRYRIVVRKLDKDTGSHRDFDDIEAGETESEKGDVAFTFRRDLDPEDTYSEVDIEAGGLRGLLKEIIGSDYPGQNFDGETVNISAPFAPLVHNWEKLENAAKPSPHDPNKTQAREDLARLLECVRGARELEQYFKTRESNLGAAITTYDTMWTLFAPKTKVVARPFLNTLQLFEVAGAPMSWESTAPPKRYVLVWCWDWNGKEMVKVYYYFLIKRFRGTKDINELLCYPVKYYKDGSIKDREDLFATIRDRGAKYNKIVRSKPGATQMYAYNGDALSESQQIIRSAEDDLESNSQSSLNDDDRTLPSLARHNRRKPVSVKGKFIVDAEAFLQYGASSHSLGEYEPVLIGDSSNQSDESRQQGQCSDRESNEDFFLLYPPRVLGYSTKEKMWGQFGVDGTSDAPGKQLSKFKEMLQLDDRYKQMIQALVDEHEGKDEIKDVVEDKGKGLVLLLHGPPGVGKTLTAETIAEATGKPLFVVSVAEIGLNASKAEKNLEQMFYLAGKWEAVLLVDEADVFLEMRSSQSDPNRNALVSVLLRVLEYYHGIMILTTNRMTAIDIAVQSRIHLAIRYDDLTKEQKRSVFKLFLNQLKPESIKDMKSILDFIDEYGIDYKLNGRQIRNVMSSALSLARSSAKERDGDDRLTQKDLKQVMTLTRDFQEQLESITMDQRNANEATRSRK